MFAIFNKNKKSVSADPEELTDSKETDETLIAIITAAIVRYRESTREGAPDAGFIVRRIRRI